MPVNTRLTAAALDSEIRTELSCSTSNGDYAAGFVNVLISTDAGLAWVNCPALLRPASFSLAQIRVNVEKVRFNQNGEEIICFVEK